MVDAEVFAREYVVDSHHYGIVEDVHLQLGHVIAYYFRQRITDSLGRAE